MNWRKKLWEWFSRPTVSRFEQGEAYAKIALGKGISEEVLWREMEGPFDYDDFDRGARSVLGGRPPDVK